MMVPITDRCVWIDYVNWRGERAWRRIEPLTLFWGQSPWHMTPQWLLQAHDVERGEARSFAMNDIHAWTTEKPNALA